MLRHRRHGDPDRLLQLGHRALAVEQLAQDQQARPARHRLEQPLRLCGPRLQPL